MKRDMDLAREVLMALEASPGPGMGCIDLEFPGRTKEEIAYHVRLLDEAGLINAVDLTTSDGIDWRPARLTWAGHEFLEAAKNDRVWRKAKDWVLSKGGSLTFEVLKATLSKFALAVVAE